MKTTKTASIKTFLCLIFALALLTANYAKANKANATATKNSASYAASYLPSIYFAGYAENSSLIENAAALFPILINQQRALFLFGEVDHNAADQNNTQNNFYLSSLGIGYRQFYNPETIIGTYLLANYNSYHTNASNFNFAELNPGIEILGEKLELRGNAYIPLSKKTWECSGWANQFNDYQYIQFKQHQEFDRWLTLQYQQSSSVGFDTTIGYNIFAGKNVTIKTSIGGYYYNQINHAALKGGFAEISIQPKPYLTFSANGMYDNYQHKTFGIGIKIGLDKLFAKRDADTERLLTNINHLSKILNLPNNLPKILSTSQIGKLGLARDNIYFFDSSNKNNYRNSYRNIYQNNSQNNIETETDGSYEHPFNKLDQEKINLISQSGKPAYLYLTPGVYEVDNALVLQAGQSIFGRSNDYTQPAIDQARPQIIGALTLIDNNILDSIILQNALQNNDIDKDSGNSTAIKINNNADNIIINNVQIGTNTAAPLNDNENHNNNSYNYSTAIAIDTAKHVKITDSQIYVYNNSGNAIGIQARHIDQLDVINSSISVSAKNSENNDDAGNAYGILIGYDNVENSDHNDLSIHGNNVAIINSILSATASGGAKNSGNAYGMLVGYNDANISVSGKNNLPIYNNQISIINSTLLGAGESVNTGNNNSGNSYGLAIGYGNLVPTVDQTAAAAADFSIHNNLLQIENSNLHGETPINSNSGSNAFGLLIGYNEALPAIYAPKSTIDLSIHDNSINITNSSLSGKTNATDNYDGNAYGFLLGYSTANPTIEANDSSNNLSIFQNILSMYNDNVTGQNQSQNNLSSNSYGLLIGDNASIPEIEAENANNDFSIHNNKLTIVGSSITGIANADASLNSNAYGMLFGFNNIANFSDKTSSLNNYSLYQNKLMLADSFIQAINLNSGNSYAVLFGYETFSDQNQSNAKIENNEISIVNSNIRAATTSDDGLACGIAFAANATTNPQAINYLTVSETNFFLNGKTAWGIKMEKNSGILRYNLTNFIRTDNNSKDGAEILFPDGSVINW